MPTFASLPNVQFVGRWYAGPSNVPAAAWGPAAFHVRFSCPSACAAEVSLDDDSGSLVYTCGGTAMAETRFTSFEMRSLSVSASAGTHSLWCGRSSEGSYGESRVQSIAVSGGELVPLALPSNPLRLEVLGDSITAGYQALAEYGQTFSLELEDVFSSYERRMADAWGTWDWRVVARSGIPVSLVEEDPAGSGIISGQYDCRVHWWTGGAGSCPIAWDHAQWQADVVIINGGTNDHVYGPPTTERFAARYTELLQVVRSSQPDALIFAVVPLICNCQSSAGWLKGAIEQAVAEAGDATVSVVQTGSLSAPWLDCRDDYSDWTHPNVAGHTKFAERLLASVTETVRQAFPSKCGGSGSVCTPAGAGAAPTPAPLPVPAPTPVLPVTWRSDKLIATHYWDCSGQGCDASTLSPWDATKYWSPAGYAPQDPNDHGGPSAYGEKLWVTGAASDRLSELLGPDDGCCGASGQGGCGQCVLLENPDSIQPAWRVIAMKKNRCPPAACGTTDAHFDIAAPGFDTFQWSLSNTCGMPTREDGAGGWEYQPVSRDPNHASFALGEWYLDYDNTREAGDARCSLLPEPYQRGCRLFSEWGWTTGKTYNIKYMPIECPPAFTSHMQSLFGPSGPTDAETPVAGHSPTIESPPPPSPSPPPAGSGGEFACPVCALPACGCDLKGESWCTKETHCYPNAPSGGGFDPACETGTTGSSGYDCFNECESWMTRCDQGGPAPALEPPPPPAPPPLLPPPPPPPLPTPPPSPPPPSSQMCGVSSCTEGVLATTAVGPDSSASCGGRIQWVMDNMGKSEADACQQVGEEFPPLCGPCAPEGIPPLPPPSPAWTGGAVVALEVVTYNLYWWNVGQNNRWGALYATIEGQAFDLIGFQECEDVSSVISNVPRMSGRFDSFAPTGIPGPGDNPAPVAWDGQRFDRLGAGWMQVGSDQYGQRVTVWVRLLDRTTGATVFFANTHGPLGDCSTALGDNWMRAVTDNIAPDDLLVYTGDFNCGAGSAAINVLDGAAGGPLKLVANGGVDMIFTNGADAASWRSVNGYPSDHPLVAATFETSASASPPPSSPPAGSGEEFACPVCALPDCGCDLKGESWCTKETHCYPNAPSGGGFDPACETGTTGSSGYDCFNDAVWDTPALGPEGGEYTCGARIEWLQSQGLNLEDAKDYVANEIPTTCGPCSSDSQAPVWSGACPVCALPACGCDLKGESWCTKETHCYPNAPSGGGFDPACETGTTGSSGYDCFNECESWMTRCN